MATGIVENIDARRVLPLTIRPDDGGAVIMGFVKDVEGGTDWFYHHTRSVSYDIAQVPNGVMAVNFVPLYS